MWTTLVSELWMEVLRSHAAPVTSFHASCPLLFDLPSAENSLQHRAAMPGNPETTHMWDHRGGIAKHRATAPQNSWYLRQKQRVNDK